MIKEIMEFLVSTAFEFFTILILLRVMMQLARVDFYNPISQFIITVTNPPLKPLRRLIPGLWGIDFPALLLAIVIQTLDQVLLVVFKGALAFNFMLYVTYGFFGVLDIALQLMKLAVLAQIVISWVAPNSYHPIVILIRQLGDPIMAPLRRLIPPVGGLDFSPMIAILFIHILQKIILPNMQYSLV
ncbi:MAG: YggT family protein [Cellvibrionales bacterium]|nr:YggT family protein [Cellvibrionales bacterium]|tara:strand:- start:17033 stop:17590 length:558 start_codon:yes stop_codon:yes gene_type:complete